MVDTRRRYTFEEWQQVPDDGRLYELLNGEPVEMASPTYNHGELAGELYTWLRRAQRAGHGHAAIGPVAVLLDARHTRQNAPLPDVFFIAKAREHIITAEAVEGAPDLIIEVLSPTTRDLDLPDGEKFDLYQRHGVPHYWIVDPEERTVQQFVYAGGRLRDTATLQPGHVLSSPLFPGITLPVADLFAVMREPERERGRSRRARQVDRARPVAPDPSDREPSRRPGRFPRRSREREDDRGR